MRQWKCGDSHALEYLQIAHPIGSHGTRGTYTCCSPFTWTGPTEKCCLTAVPVLQSTSASEFTQPLNLAISRNGSNIAQHPSTTTRICIPLARGSDRSMATNGLPPPIAIIGSACRLPGGASSPSKLWKLLKDPKDVITEIPRDRFHWEGVYRPDALIGSIKTNRGYFLQENIRCFDPQFFGISPAEAVSLDPQHRLLLENVYEAIESAGLCLEDLQGADVGVFVGLMANEYYDNANFDVDASSGQILTTGTARSMASNRISYIFDFRGPSVSVDTACSSSLMAVQLAVASLRRGESTVAFVGGAHLNLNTHGFKALTRMNMISSDGRRYVCLILRLVLR